MIDKTLQAQKKATLERIQKESVGHRDKSAALKIKRLNKEAELSKDSLEA